MAPVYGLSRRRRTGIPRVNQNPRPPNEQKPRIGISGNTAVSSSRDRQRNVGTSQGNFGKPPPTQNPGAPASSSGPAFAPPVDPRDARYWNDVAQINFNRDQSLAALNSQGVFDQQAYEQALLQRTQAEPLEVQREREAANAAGAIYSTATQEDLGQLAKQQFLTRADLSGTYNQSVTQRALQQQQLQGQSAFDIQNAYFAAAQRAAEAEANRPAPAVMPSDPTAGATPADPQRAALAARVSGLQARAKNMKPGPQRQALFDAIKKLNARRAKLYG